MDNKVDVIALRNDLEAAKRELRVMRQVLEAAPPRNAVVDDRYWAWLVLKERALNS